MIMAGPEGVQGSTAQGLGYNLKKKKIVIYTRDLIFYAIH